MNYKFLVQQYETIKLRRSVRMDASAKVAYGIAKDMGINTKGMSPKEVWEAIDKKSRHSPSPKMPGNARTQNSETQVKEPKCASNEHKKQGYVGKKECGMLKEVGGYTRRHNFEHGYSYTDADDWSKSGRSGRTVRKNTDKFGNYSEEREAIHSRCIDDSFDGVKKPDGRPRCVFMGGGPGSGKSTVAKKMRKEFGLFGDGEAVTCNPDFCKEYLPEYDPKAPRPCHNESSDMAARIREIALNEGYNTLVDGTGDGGAEWMKSQINAARDAGHTVDGRYVFMPLQSAIELNKKRERTVDENTLIRLHSSVARVIPEIASDFDDFKLFANILGGEPKLIATCSRGEKITVVDEDLWKQVIETGNYYKGKK